MRARSVVTHAERHARERSFHDRVAREHPLAEALPERLEPLGAAVLQPLDLAGREVLDLGCGIGDLTVELLARGATVTALDLSPATVEVAARRVGRAGTRQDVRFVVASAEDTTLADASFDVVVGRNVLHHLDLRSAAPELARILRPGGRARFLETWGENPVLRAAREHAAGRLGIPRYGTDDEQPLRDATLDPLRERFDVSVEFPVMDFVGLLDRQVMRYRWPALSRWVQGVDRTLGRSERARRWSYRAIIDLRAAGGT